MVHCSETARHKQFVKEERRKLYWLKQSQLAEDDDDDVTGLESKCCCRFTCMLPCSRLANVMQTEVSLTDYYYFCKYGNSLVVEVVVV